MEKPASIRRHNKRWVEIPSCVSAGRAVLDVIVMELEMAGFEARQIGIVELAFTEALVNAVRHGNHDEPDKSVYIEYGIELDQFHLAIEDEGAGFRPGDVDDPTLEENRVRPGGRGLLLIRSLLDSVEFNSPGNRISMRLTRQIRSAA